jgi:hypothetical protein
MLFYLSINGATEESLRSIFHSLRDAKINNTPKLALRNNQLFVNGDDSGIQIAEFSPLKIKKDGLYWTLDKTKGLDANFSTLIALLKRAPKNASTSRLFLGSMALAYDPDIERRIGAGDQLTEVGKMNFLTGAILCLAGLAVGPELISVGAIMVVGGAVIAGLGDYGSEKAREEGHHRELLYGLSDKEPRPVSCDSKSISFKTNGFTMTILKATSKTPLKVLDNENKEIKRITPSKLAVLSRLSEKCNSKDDADKLNNEFTLAESNVNIVMSDTDAGPIGASKNLPAAPR